MAAPPPDAIICCMPCVLDSIVDLILGPEEKIAYVP